MTKIFGAEDNLINYIKECLSNTSPFANIKNNFLVKKTLIKNYIATKQGEINALGKRENVYESIINGIIFVFGDDNFKYKTKFLQSCKYCDKIWSNIFEKRYKLINLENYIGEDIDLSDFFEPLCSEWLCKNCRKLINSKIEYISLPEIFIIILGSKGEEKSLLYEYKLKIKFLNINNEYEYELFTLKSLIGQIDGVEFMPFIFKSEEDFKLNFENNKKIFSYPTILFYEKTK